MIRLRVDPDAPDPAALDEAAAALARGGIVAFPTDTFYGLAVDPSRGDAVARLYDAKGRPAERALPLIAADAAQVERLVGPLSTNARRLALHVWPGPLSLIVPAALRIVPDVSDARGRVAVRVPAHPVARELARRAGPITATSANRSGEAPAATADAVVAAFGEGLDVVLDAGPTPGGEPSTIVDVTVSPPVLVRAGAVPWLRVLEFLEHVERDRSR